LRRQRLDAQWPRPTFSRRSGHRGALQKFARVADGQAFAIGGIGARCKVGVEFAGASSGEYRQTVFRASHVQSQGRNRRLNGCYAGSGTGNVLLLTDASVTA